MPYAIRYREELPEPVQRELDDMIAYFNHQLDIALAPDGTIKPSALVPPAGTNITDESHWWRKGPWSFDDPDAADPNIAAILTPDIPGPVSVNDFAPKGIESCIILQLSPITGAVTLNGIQSPNPRRRRIMLLYNVSTTQNIILANAAAGSQPTNRFNLPNGNVTLAPGQTMWLYWSIAGWNAAITAQQSGGLFGEGSTSFPSTVTTIPFTFNTTFSVSAQLTKTDVDGLNGSPLVLVTGQGATKIIQPISFTVSMTRGGQWTNGGTSFILRYAGQTQALCTATSSLNAVGAGNSVVVNTNNIGTETGGTANANADLQFFCTSDANPGAQTGHVEVTAIFYIHTIV
jgi:hypothetical protein